MAFDAWQYGNPERVLERKQQQALNKSCADCKHKLTMEFAIETVSVCNLTNRICFKRCKSFKLKVSQ
jgi:hypothetical protein